jgi:hypothetical protein
MPQVQPHANRQKLADVQKVAGHDRLPDKG